MSTNHKINISAKNNTNRAFDAVNKNVKDITNNLLSAKGAFTGFIGVAGVTKLVNMTKESIEFADAIAKTSAKLGVSTDALQEYRFAAERGNIEQTALDTGLQRFTRRLGEAAEGTGVLYGVLKDNNIQIRDTEGNLRNTEDVLRDYANTIQGAETDQEKLLLAFKAFDTEGAAMVNILRDGSAGLDKLRQSAREAGVVMDAELIRKAEIINDRWETLTATIGTKFKSAMIGLADQFIDSREETERLEHQLTVLVAEMNKVADAGRDTWLQRNFGTTSQEKIAAIAEQIQGVSNKLNNLNQKSESGDGQPPLIKALGLTDQQIQDTIALDGYVWQLLQENRQVQIDESELLELEAQERKRMNLLAHYAEEEKYAADKAGRIAEIEQRETKDQLAKGESAFSTMLGNVASHNKTFFKIQKLYRLSKLAMEAPAAIADSYAWGASWGGPPAGATMAAIAGAAMATYGADLASASYGGSGSGTGSSASSVSPVIDQVLPGQTTSYPQDGSANQSGRALTVNIYGAITKDMVRDTVIPVLQDDVINRDLIIIRGDSRNAQELVT